MINKILAAITIVCLTTSTMLCANFGSFAVQQGDTRGVVFWVVMTLLIALTNGICIWEFTRNDV